MAEKSVLLSEDSRVLTGWYVNVSHWPSNNHGHCELQEKRSRHLIICTDFNKGGQCSFSSKKFVVVCFSLTRDHLTATEFRTFIVLNGMQMCHLKKFRVTVEFNL